MNVLQGNTDKVPNKFTASIISTACMNAANTMQLRLEPKKGAHKKIKFT